MAVKEANSIYKSFTFNGVSAADYGVYVTDVNVFNSAERAVEYITIPGRNGSFALDHGRFENITVEYECALGQDTDVDFATAISDFRNALAAAKGYQRLEDDMNPDEYRMAVFSKGLEAPTLNQQTATFKVEFNCKPQRYLKSGETAVSISSGGTISNPTLYDASPLLQVWGYGDIGINGQQLSINSAPVGDVLIDGAYTSEANNKPISRQMNLTALNNGNRFYIYESEVKCWIIGDGISSPLEQIQVQPVAQNPLWGVYAKSDGNIYGEDAIYIDFLAKNSNRVDFRKNQTGTVTEYYMVSAQGITPFEISVEAACSASGVVTFSVSTSDSDHEVAAIAIKYNKVQGYSSKSALGEPLYFDLDIGEAYKEEDGEIISVNNAVTIPAKLPVLVPGSNAITYDNTITQFKIVPRWWKV